MPTLTVELLQGMDDRWSRDVPASLADRLNPDTFARSIDSFNSALYLLPLTQLIHLSMLAVGVVLVGLGFALEGIVKDELTFAFFCIGGGLGILESAWFCVSSSWLYKRLIRALAVENIDPRDWRLTPHSSPVSVYWSLSTRPVRVYTSNRSTWKEGEDTVIICEVTYEIDEVQSEELVEVEGENIFENGNRTEEHPLESEGENPFESDNRPEGTVAEGVVTIDIHETVEPAASALLALSNSSASAPPRSSVPHEQYVRQLQILNGER